MPNNTIAMAADHGGFNLKAELKDYLEEKGFSVLDLGTNTSDSVDYPDFGHALAEAVLEGKADRGVLVCGSGIGISIAANRHNGIRAALCTNGLMARLSRQHNDANVIVFGERLTGVDIAKDCLNEFLNTEFEGGRHVGRAEKLDR